MRHGVSVTRRRANTRQDHTNVKAPLACPVRTAALSRSTFNEMPRQRYSNVHVLGPDGQRRDSGSVQVINDSVHQQLGGTRPAGRYTVDWRVISADGHPVSGQFTYTAVAASSPLASTKTAANTASSGKSSTGSGTVVLVVVLVVVLLVAAVAGYLWCRRPSRVAAHPSDD